MAANVDEALFALLAAAAALTDVLGETASGTPAMWAGLLPEAMLNSSGAVTTGVFPALTWHRIADRDWAQTQQGSSGLFQTRYQFTCWGQTMSDAMAAARALRGFLHGFEGAAGGYNLGPCFLISQTDRFEGAENLFQTHLDFYISNNG